MSPRFVKTPAVVLKTGNYSETSLLVTAFARDLGKVRLIAKGARRRKSPFAGLIEPLAPLELVLVPGRSGLHTLTECAPLGPVGRLRDELGRLSAGLFVLALVDQTQADEDPQPAVFDLMTQVLEQLETARNVPALLFAFQLRLIELSGYGLDLERCSGDEASHDQAPLKGTGFYSPRHKGFLCKPCRSGLSGRAVSAGGFNVLKRLDGTPFEHVGRMRLSKAQTAELARLFDCVLETLLEKKLTVTSIIRKLGTPPAG